MSHAKPYAELQIKPYADKQGADKQGADKQGGPIEERKQACQAKVEISEKPNSL